VDRTLKRSEILRGKNCYRQIITNGISFGGKAIRGKVALIDSPTNTQEIRYFMGIMIRRSIKHAVDRNRIKRWIRESYRTHKALLDQRKPAPQRPIGIIFTCCQNSSLPGNLSFAIIESDIKSILNQIILLQF
jgi:ribonuclease P protein component